MKNSFLNAVVCLIYVSRLAYAEPLSASDAILELTQPSEDLIKAHAEMISLEQQLVHGGKSPRAASTYNADKSKIDSIFGKWLVSYNLNGVQTDTIEIDTTYQDKERGYYGWDSKHAISCFYEPGLLGTIYSYECLHITQTNPDAAKTITQRYLFNINGNNLTGKYHSGNVNDFIQALRANQLADLAGYNPLIAPEAYFNEVTGELIIPKVTILGKKYNAILKYDGGDVLRLKAFNPL